MEAFAALLIFSGGFITALVIGFNWAVTARTRGWREGIQEGRNQVFIEAVNRDYCEQWRTDTGDTCYRWKEAPDA